MYGVDFGQWTVDLDIYTVIRVGVGHWTVYLSVLRVDIRCWTADGYTNMHLHPSGAHFSLGFRAHRTYHLSKSGSSRKEDIATVYGFI